MPIKGECLVARRIAVWSAAVLLLIVAAAAVVKVRGFRASSEPSAVETKVARSVRDFAIPGAEAHRVNPLANDSEAIAQGRDLYLTQCASCHGTDGRGMTPVGANVYPRVPDLRAAETQKLSDGEMHYIIVNGVQLTGMPALGDDADGQRDGWKLAAFVRSLHGAGTPGAGVERTAVAGAHYVGSAACESCHKDIYARWKKTPMANVVRDPKVHPDAIIPDLKTNDVAKFSVDQVAFTYGSLWKQRYFTKVGGDYYPLGAQWDIGNKKWLKYHVPDTGADWWTAFYPSDNMQRPTGPTCDGCHSVNYDIHTKQVSEWNVGCEKCHGPGSEHAAHPTRTNVLNPSAMDDVAANDSCIQCHSQGQPKGGLIDGKAYDWPVGYTVGGKLSDYWKLEDVTLGQTDFFHYADASAHKNRMQGNDFVQSVMYEKGVTCASCHDVHGTANYAQLRKPAEKICLDCHAAGSANGPHVASLEEHTHHKAGSAGSQCVACHMPKIATEGVPGAFVTSHTFRFVTPAMTDKYKIPNACTSCHKDKDNAWATKELAGWSSASPWRVAQK